MRIIDISVPVSPGLPVWPGDPSVTLERYLTLAGGGGANVSRIACSVHVGTHVDAAVHHIEGGAAVDELDLDDLVGPAFVADLTGRTEIGPDDLDGLALPEDTRRLLLKTDNSQLWRTPEHRFHESYVALTTDGATWVAERGIRLIGIDYHSIQLYADLEPETHRTLLGAGVVVLEGANLGHVDPGPYLLACLPLKLVGSDGAPARAVLIDGL